MASLNDIVAVAEALEKSPVIVVRDRCAAVRNRNSSCRRCTDICPVNALDVSGNEITLSVSSCIGCGACCVVCPTKALVFAKPSDAELDERAYESLRSTNGTAVFACARIASKRIADPSTYAEVPCLSRIDEAAIVIAASRGAREVLLVDGDCSSCKYGACSSITDETLAYARSLLSTHGPGVQIRRLTGFPEKLRSSTPSENAGTSRRAFFSEAVGVARDTAIAAAKTTVENELGITDGEAAIGERLRVTESGSLPRISVQRHDDILNALDRMGVHADATIESRLFAVVSVDEVRCNSCGMCAMFCPTGALVRDKPKELGDPMRYLEFSACDCVQCNLCKDVCWKSALTLTPTVPADELYDFEPTVFKPGSRG